MERHGRTNLTEAVRSVQLFKIDGYCATEAMSSSDYIKSRWSVDGHEWEVHLYPKHFKSFCEYWVAVKLVLRSQPPRKTWANLTCRLVDPSRNLDPSQGWSVSYEFEQPKECNLVLLVKREDDFLKRMELRDDLPSSGYLVNDSVTVECTITVLRHLPADGIVIPADREVPLPSSDLQRHLAELLQGQRGADVTLVLDSGERFPAHKTILAARSPVFMAEFFGDMNERRSQSVRIQDMQAAVFKAMLHFIYTDKAPELEEEPEAPSVATMAQHLLAAADRYGLDRLKLICEGKLSTGIDVDTAATTLALAEQHNCSLLKTKCIEFIARSPETLDAVLATDGYRHLAMSCPLVLAELLRVARGRRN